MGNHVGFGKDETMRTSDIETHKAERVHECHACGQRIERGETYWRRRLWDGDNAKTLRMHTGCVAAQQLQERFKADLAVNGKAEQEGGQRA